MISILCFPSAYPTTLGDVWVGETKPSIETLLEIIRLNEVSVCKSVIDPGLVEHAAAESRARSKDKP